MSEQPSAPMKQRSRRMPSGLADVLQADETLRRIAKISTGIYWKAIAVFGLAIFLLLTVFNLGVFMLGVSVLTFIAAWLTRHYLLLALTDRRVIVRNGVLALEVVQIHYNKVESVELAWTLMGRFLGYATVVITGTGSRISAVPFVANAVAFRAELDALLTAQEERVIKVENVTPSSIPPTSA